MKRKKKSIPLRPEKDLTLDSTLALARALMVYHRYEVRGMQHVPRLGAALIAVSHSLATYDSFLLGAQIYIDTGRLVATLADRRIFQTPGISQFFTKLRAVEGNPNAGERLLREGNLLVLAPGGMREALRPSTEKYRIDWKNRRGFARLAIQAQVPVLVAACPGADDIYTLYDNPLTRSVYDKFRWPLPMFRGFGPTLVPRPVKLVHRIAPPLEPPEGPPTDEKVQRFHEQLVETMEEAMRETPTSQRPQRR